MPTPAEIAAEAVAQLKEAKRTARFKGADLSWPEVQAIIEQACSVPADALALDPSAPRSKVPKARLDALFDALCAVQKCNAKQITRHAKGQIVEARKQIMEASPEVTPEDIEKRAASYRRKWPTWHLSALSLCKHWAELGPANPTLAAKTDIYQEPKAYWKPVALKVSGLSTFPEAWANWSDIPANWRTQILAKL